MLKKSKHLLIKIRRIYLIWVQLNKLFTSLRDQKRILQVMTVTKTYQNQEERVSQKIMEIRAFLKISRNLWTRKRMLIFSSRVLNKL
jgi:hypothetical protein